MNGRKNENRNLDSYMEQFNKIKDVDSDLLHGERPHSYDRLEQLRSLNYNLASNINNESSKICRQSLNSKSKVQNSNLMQANSKINTENFGQTVHWVERDFQNLAGICSQCMSKNSGYSGEKYVRNSSEEQVSKFQKSNYEYKQSKTRKHLEDRYSKEKIVYEMRTPENTKSKKVPSRHSSKKKKSIKNEKLSYNIDFIEKAMNSNLKGLKKDEVIRKQISRKYQSPQIIEKESVKILSSSNNQFVNQINECIQASYLHKKFTFKSKIGNLMIHQKNYSKKNPSVNKNIQADILINQKDQKINSIDQKLQVSILPKRNLKVSKKVNNVLIFGKNIFKERNNKNQKVQTDFFPAIENIVNKPSHKFINQYLEMDILPTQTIFCNSKPYFNSGGSKIKAKEVKKVNKKQNVGSTNIFPSKLNISQDLNLNQKNNGNVLNINNQTSNIMNKNQFSPQNSFPQQMPNQVTNQNYYEKIEKVQNINNQSQKPINNSQFLPQNSFPQQVPNQVPNQNYYDNSVKAQNITNQPQKQMNNSQFPPQNSYPQQVPNNANNQTNYDNSVKAQNNKNQPQKPLNNSQFPSKNIVSPQVPNQIPSKNYPSNQAQNLLNQNNYLPEKYISNLSKNSTNVGAYNEKDDAYYSKNSSPKKAENVGIKDNNFVNISEANLINKKIKNEVYEKNVVKEKNIFIINQNVNNEVNQINNLNSEENIQLDLNIDNREYLVKDKKAKDKKRKKMKNKISLEEKEVEEEFDEPEAYEGERNFSISDDSKDLHEISNNSLVEKNNDISNNIRKEELNQRKTQKG